MGIKTEILTVTPSIASKWIDEASKSNNGSANYRRHNDDRSRRYATEIKEKRWDLNGESLKFDDHGILIDGQHRLRGCILAGVPFKTLVVFGVKSIDAIDVGTPRSFTNWIARQGLGGASHLAAVTSHVMRLDRQLFRIKSGGSAAGKLEINDQIEGWRRWSPLIQETLKLHGTRQYYISPSRIHAISVMFWKADQKKAAQWNDAVRGRMNLPDGDPVKAFRSILEGWKNVHPSLTMIARPWFALAIKSWNYWEIDRSVSRLAWREVGPSAEAFPDILGYEYPEKT
jgi:hypothetical protein